MESKLKILVVRFSSIGDIVLTSPVVRMLKKQLNAEIHYLTKSSFVPLLKTNIYIDSVYQIEHSIHEIISDLRQEKYDYLVDLHNNFRTTILKFRLGVPSTSFSKLNIQKFLFTNFKINKLPESHIVDRYLETIKQFNITNDNEGLDFFLSDEDVVSSKEYIDVINKEYIAFVIGGRHFTKMLPLEKIITIIHKLKKPVILIGGPADFEKGEQIVKQSFDTLNACGKFTINQSAYLLKHAEYVITHDTGMMHIAAALKKKIYSVWGSTVPEFGMTPYKTGEMSTIIEVKNLDCRPCSKIGYNKCPERHFKCMKAIDEDLFC